MSFPLLPASAAHPTEELLEEYCFSRVGGPALACLEEHLLVCVDCQGRLEEAEACIALIKNATSAWERDHDGLKTGPGPRARFPRGRGAFIGAALAAGLACVLLPGGRSSSLVKPNGVNPNGPSTVKLMAMRGGEFDGLASAPAGRALDLKLDRNSLPPQGGYRLEMVNQEGRRVWSGVPETDGAALSAHITKSPQPGVYWLRLYSGGGELLREFGMRVE